MQFHLATVRNIETPCKDAGCQVNRDFDHHVQQLGARLGEAAFVAYPDLNRRLSQFKFEVAEKAEPGTSSSASGKIVIFRGVQNLHLYDEALSFVMAREMGHVISRHHDEKTATRLLFSVAAGVLFPALNLFTSSTTLAQASSLTSTATAASTAASSATSFVGSKVVLDNLQPYQSREADAIAIVLLERQGWDKTRVARAAANSTPVDGSGAWASDYRLSVAKLKAIGEQARVPVVALQVEPSTPPALQVAATEQVSTDPIGIDSTPDSAQVGLVSEPDQSLGKEIQSAEVINQPVEHGGSVAVATYAVDDIVAQTDKVTSEETSRSPANTPAVIPAATLAKADTKALGDANAKQATSKPHLTNAKLAKKPLASNSKQAAKVKPAKSTIIASRGTGKASQAGKVLQAKAAMGKGAVYGRTRPANARVVVTTSKNKQVKFKQDVQQPRKATVALNNEIGKSKKTDSNPAKEIL
jgi:hypothetical protein